jgi:hypothetical protein
MRFSARDQLVKDGAQGIDVGAVVDDPGAACLFRRHVRDGSQDHTRVGDRVHSLQVMQLRDAEIEHLQKISSVLSSTHEEVLWFEIAMNDAGVVGDLDPPAGLRHEIGRA